MRQTSHFGILGYGERVSSKKWGRVTNLILDGCCVDKESSASFWHGGCSPKESRRASEGHEHLGEEGQR